MRRVALSALLAVVALAGCGGDSSSSGSPSAAGDGIVDVDGIEPIREQFNRDQGSPRLLLVFSPT